MLQRIVLTGALVVALAGRCAAQALPTYPLTPSGPSTTSWFPDRYPPSVFNNVGPLDGRQNVLDLGLSAADGQMSRAPIYSSAFYNLQGRKIDAGDLHAPVSWVGSLYIPASWGMPNAVHGSATRRSELWSTLWPAMGGDTCPSSGCNLFPIIGFTNSAPPDHDDDPGGTPRYRVFDGNNGGFNDLATPVVYDAWTDFCLTFTGTSVEYRINGQLVYTATDVVADPNYGPVTMLHDVMAQAYNYGYDYDANWSNLAAGANATCAQLEALFAPPGPAPAPAASLPALAAMLALLLLAGGVALRRARRR